MLELRFRDALAANGFKTARNPRYARIFDAAPLSPVLAAMAGGDGGWHQA
jgi:hypothetical protein